MLGDHEFSLRMRAVIKAYVKEEIAKFLPGDRYAIVQTIDYTNRKASVLFHNATTAVNYPFSADCQPTQVGQRVRISGGPSNRYIGALMDKSTWTDATLTNSWANVGGAFANAGYIRDPAGRVHLRGAIHAGTLGSSALTLPAGFRPAVARVYMASNGGAAGGAVSVLIDGTVIPASSFTGGNAFISLDGIAFPAA